MRWKEMTTFVLCLLFFWGTIVQIDEDFVRFFSNNICKGGETDYPVPLSSENWLVFPREDDSPFSKEDVRGIGFVLTIDENNIVSEDRLRDVKVNYPRQSGMGIVFLPPVEPKRAEQFCRFLQEMEEEKDYIWLCNGDELSGTLISADLRHFTIKAYGVMLFVPRYKVRAIRFGNKSELKEFGQSGVATDY